jgi:hypothetical protein
VSSSSQRSCVFGVMFYPDKVRANGEARRVLGSGGQYLLVSFDRLEANPVPKAAGDAVDALFPDDPPLYMQRGPFSYADPTIRAVRFPSAIPPLSTVRRTQSPRPFFPGTAGTRRSRRTS